MVEIMKYMGKVIQLLEADNERLKQEIASLKEDQKSLKQTVNTRSNTTLSIPFLRVV